MSGWLRWTHRRVSNCRLVGVDGCFSGESDVLVFENVNVFDLSGHLSFFPLSSAGHLK